ncbi:MAG: DUF4097 family beta strand repeat-containing protein [Acidimicrobiia bacterium]
MVDRVRITTTSGKVTVIAEPRDAIGIEGADPSVSGAGSGEVEVRGGSSSFTVRVPIGSDVVVGSSSGNVSLRGDLGAVSVTTSSADVTAAMVASIDARTVSGKLTVDLSRGAVRLGTKSARVHVGRVEGEVRVATVSGNVVVDEALGEVAVKTVSGSISVLVAGRAPVGVETISGKINISVPAGVKPAIVHRSVSGKRRVELETGDDLTIATRSISGDVTVGVA